MMPWHFYMLLYVVALLVWSKHYKRWLFLNKPTYFRLVDQFEEIFRFRKEGDSDEADEFISLLLKSAAQREVSIYVVITMRSDFLALKSFNLFSTNPFKAFISLSDMLRALHLLKVIPWLSARFLYRMSSS